MARVGDSLGRYELVEQLGKGAAGTVFRARDTLLGIDVCVKILHESLSAQPGTMERFKRELLLARRVAHPGICKIFDMQEAAGTHFLTMEYAPGETLAAQLKRDGKKPALEATRLLRKIAEALGAAHKVGVVHRDIKPGNIIIRDQERVTIVDFGVATAQDVDRLTRAGVVLGSRSYMAPEAWEGKPVTAASDVWALGVILYGCVTGTLPYTGEGVLGVFDAIQNKKPPPPRALNPEVTDALEAVIFRAMCVDVAGRYPDASAMEAALADVEMGWGSSASTPDALPSLDGIVLPPLTSPSGRAVINPFGRPPRPLPPQPTQELSDVGTPATPAAEPAEQGTGGPDDPPLAAIVDEAPAMDSVAAAFDAAFAMASPADLAAPAEGQEAHEQALPDVTGHSAPRPVVPAALPMSPASVVDDVEKLISDEGTPQGAPSAAPLAELDHTQEVKPLLTESWSPSDAVTEPPSPALSVERAEGMGAADSAAGGGSAPVVASVPPSAPILVVSRDHVPPARAVDAPVRAERRVAPGLLVAGLVVIVAALGGVAALLLRDKAPMTPPEAHVPAPGGDEQQVLGEAAPVEETPPVPVAAADAGEAAGDGWDFGEEAEEGEADDDAGSPRPAVADAAEEPVDEEVAAATANPVDEPAPPAQKTVATAEERGSSQGRDPLRARFKKVQGQLARAMGARGILPGDVAALDVKRRAMAAAARRGDYRAAQRDAEAAVALLARVNVDKSFVGNKLQRFNVRYDKIKDAGLRAKLKAVLKTVSIAYSKGSFEDANRALNQAFGMMGR